MKCHDHGLCALLIASVCYALVSSEFMSIELSHVQTFEVDAFEEQEFIRVPDEELEKSLQRDVLKFESLNKDRKKEDINQKEKVTSKATDAAEKEHPREYDSNEITNYSIRHSVLKYPPKSVPSTSLSEITKQDTDSNFQNAINTEGNFHVFDNSVLLKALTTPNPPHAIRHTEAILGDSDVSRHNYEQTIVNTSALPISGDAIISEQTANAKRTTTLSDLNNSYYERQLQFLSRLYRGKNGKILNSESLNHLDYETQISRPKYQSAISSHGKETILSRLRRIFLSERKINRKRRQIPLDANEGWTLRYTTYSPKDKSTKPLDSFQIVSDEDRKKAEQEKIKKVLIYVASTLGSVFLFSLIAYCFIKNPKTCIASFATGCPCCILCAPLFNKLAEKYNPKALMRENVNRYLPGVIIHEDGRTENYDPTPEELEIVGDIIDEIQSAY